MSKKIILFEPSNVGEKFEYEVTEQAVKYYQEYYPILHKFESIERRQMTTPGFALKSNDIKIDIVGDVLTSITHIGETINGSDDKKVKDRFDLLKRIYHCYGNLIPCAEGVNTRWGVTKTDIYDKKLEDVKKYIEMKNRPLCDDNEVKQIEKRIEKIEKGEEGEKLGTGLCNKLCLRYWLQKSYVDKNKNWCDFVNDFYLQDFVDEKYNVIEFKKNGIKFKKLDNKNQLDLITELCVKIIKREYRIEKRKYDFYDLEKNIDEYDIVLEKKYKSKNK